MQNSTVKGRGLLSEQTIACFSCGGWGANRLYYRLYPPNEHQDLELTLWFLSFQSCRHGQRSVSGYRSSLDIVYLDATCRPRAYDQRMVFGSRTGLATADHLSSCRASVSRHEDMHGQVSWFGPYVGIGLHRLEHRRAISPSRVHSHLLLLLRLHHRQSELVHVPHDGQLQNDQPGNVTVGSLEKALEYIGPVDHDSRAMHEETSRLARRLSTCGMYSSRRHDISEPIIVTIIIAQSTACPVSGRASSETLSGRLREKFQCGERERRQTTSRLRYQSFPLPSSTENDQVHVHRCPDVRSLFDAILRWIDYHDVARESHLAENHEYDQFRPSHFQLRVLFPDWLMTIFSLLFNLNSCSNPIICLTLSGTLLR